VGKYFEVHEVSKKKTQNKHRQQKSGFYL